MHAVMKPRRLPSFDLPHPLKHISAQLLMLIVMVNDAFFMERFCHKIIVVSNESALGSLCFCVERPQLHRVVAHLDDVTQSVTPDVP